jgi:hypothetical protein
MNPETISSEVRPENEEDNAQFQAVIRALERAGAEVDVFAAIACNDVQRVRSMLQTNPKAGEAESPAGRPALHQRRHRRAVSGVQRPSSSF